MCTVSIHHVCRGIGRHVNYGSSIRQTWKVNVTINEIFYHSMLTGTKHVANDSFIFQQDSALAHHACNTVQLLESETLNFTHFDYVPPPNSVEVNPIDDKISRVIHWHEYMLRVNKIEEIQQ